MNKVIILGAGATFGAHPINSYLKPPLLKDLPNILHYDFLSLNRSKDGPLFNKGSNELVDLTNTRNDIEKFFTVLFLLEMLSADINPSYVFMHDDEIKDLLSNHQKLKKYFINDSEMEIAKIILKYYLSNKKEALMVCPRNLRTFFQSSLREYMFQSLTNCYCKYHSKAFGGLDDTDSVINFNYDEVADFTLFTLDKLGIGSFENLGFDGIVFPKKKQPVCCVKYLKMHGSFNWWTNIESKEVFYNLISEASSEKHLGNTFFPIVLPFLSKKIFYQTYSILKKHLYQFENLLEESKEILLIGKTFMNSDEELSRIIKTHSISNKKKLIIINPKIASSEFIRFHEKLFNAEYIKGWKRLYDYFIDQNGA